MTARQCLPLLCAILAGALAVPTPGRIPKVYNALITSNQNLVPSKAYPVYQPVLHNVLPFPYQPIFYGDLPLTHGLIPVPAAIPKDASAKPEESPSATTETPRESEPADNSSPSSPEPNPAPEDDKPTPAPSSLEPPKTESPIPLNEFGLPPQVLPLGGGHFSPAYHYTQFTFPYTYPGLRLYDPYNPFGYNPYAALPLYQPITNILGAGVPVPSLPAPKPEAPVASSASSDQSSQTPPPEPSDLNVLNYSSKDPAIPNVPPPPLPQGGLKTNTE